MAELIEMPAPGVTARRPEAIPAGAPPDWRERERAMDIGASWIVEAPAGSGKTGLLIQRYLKLLAEGGVERPEQVLAITFTKAATDEIRNRVMAEMEGAAAGTVVTDRFDRTTRGLAEAVLRVDGQRGWGLLESPRRLNLRTIDSVCAEIVRALPVTSGGGAGLTPVEDAGSMYREASRRTLLQMGGKDAALNEALRAMLLHRDGSLADCERLIAEMLKARDQWRDLVPGSGEELSEDWMEGTVRKRLDRALEMEVCRGLTKLTRAIPPEMLDEITLLAAEMGEAPGLGEVPSPVAICARLRTTPGEALEHMEHWQALIHLLVKNDGEWRAGFRSDWLRFSWDQRHTPPIRGLIASLQDHAGVLAAIQHFNKLPPARYPDDQWTAAKAILRVLSRALTELQMVFREREACDFAEPALRARAALRQERGMESYESTLGMELRHLLVDEMQDTSASQYELIELLTREWDGTGKTVFLVGDPKQSIYLFRQARVERFVATMETERMGDLRLRRLRLTANFRTQAGLVRALDEDFAQVFGAGGDQGEAAPIVSAQAVRAATGGVEGEGGLAWHTAVADTGAGAGRSKRRLARRNAKAVRSVAERWRARPLPEGRSAPWRMAVLVRSRRELREIVAALKGDESLSAIPFRAVKVEPLKEQREVLDLVALTRALKHPGDRVAWMAVLRAPWCGLELADLHVLSGADRREFAERTVVGLVEARAAEMGDDGQERLGRVWPVLEAAMERRARVRLPELVERTWRSMGGDAALPDAELANALRYLELLDEIDRETGGIEIATLTRRLEGLYAAAKDDALALDLMTIHGAKGLEWDVVMVPEMERRAPPTRGRLLDWEEMAGEAEDAAQVMLAPIKGKGDETASLNRWVRGMHSAREAAERRRLFYVASTRAREELHLFGTANQLKGGAVKAESGSLLDAAWPAAEVRFRGVAEKDVPSEVDGVFDLAAAADETGDGSEMRPAMLERIPSGFDAAARFRRAVESAPGDMAMERPRWVRPAGSFAARSFGNAVHTFLEMAARRLADGTTEEAIAAAAGGWKSRATAVLRGDGLAPAVAERMAGRVILALTNTLREPVGRWLLGARAEARNEYAQTSWGEEWTRVRMDRMFRGGEAPEAAGTDYLWIVDYKTGSHGTDGIDAFLERERQRYAGQMEAYARASGEAGVRLGLWFPMVGRLRWWVAGS